MPKMIQIRNVPDELHREAKVRAARAGMTLSDYLLREIRHSLEAPDVHELLEQIRAEEPIHATESIVDIIREERESR